MGLSILSNIPSLEAQNQLATTNMNLQNTLFQLSSGSKINSGADDPAGLSIADGLQANISALTQSAQNVTDGVGMLQTADGALSQVTTLLNRAVTLATEAGNAGLTTDQQNALQTEFASITQEINQIGSNTTYNNNQVFTNQLTSVFLSDGSQVDAADPTISVTIPTLSASALGLSSYATGTIDLTGQPTAGNTVQIGTQTYTFTAAGQANAANDVALGSNVQGTLENLQNAVNGTGTASAGTYGVGTAANTAAQITSVNGGSAVVQALAAGTPGNSVTLNTSFTSNVGAGSGTTLSGGANALFDTGTLTLTAQPGLPATATGSVTMSAQPDTITTATGSINLTALPTAGQTVTVGDQTYTFDAAANMGTDGANNVAIDAGGSVEATLQNLQDAVNGTGTSGTNWSAGTTASTTAMITQITGGAGAASATVSATVAGVGSSGSGTGNYTVLSSDITGAVAPSGTLSGGAAADTVTVGGTTYTFVAAGQAAAADQVALGATNLDTLTNLMNAINGTGTAGNTTYGAGTAANATAMVTSVNGDILNLEAASGGVAAPGAGNGTTTGNSVALSATSPVGALTVSGADLAGGANADTVTIGNVTYTFVAAGQATAGNEVALGADYQHTLNNLMAAVNSTAAANGSAATYHLASAAMLQSAQGAAGATITGDANGVATVQALTSGVLANGISMSGVFQGGNATATFGGLTNPYLSGGSASTAATGMVDLAANPTSGDTLTIGATTYTFVAAGSANAAGDVAIGGTMATTLTNLMNAVNNTGTSGVDTFDNGGAANADASITSINDGQAVVTALAAGVGGNAYALSGTFANTDNVAGTPGGGAAAIASSGYLALNSVPSSGNTVTIGNQTYTFTSGTPTAANQVELGDTITATLNNLEEAVNNGPNGTGAGTAYGTGTVANTEATITSVTGNQALITASNAGASGNTLTLSANLTNGGGGGTVGTVGSKLSGGGASVDLSSSSDAQNALTVIAGAISTVAATRGAIGSSINQMNAAVQVMNNTSQNLTSSLSGIQDANIGQVVANMSKYQVLEQTGIAALTQANQQEQTVLKLLQ